jgi:hypothetical protein
MRRIAVLAVVAATALCVAAVAGAAPRATPSVAAAQKAAAAVLRGVEPSLVGGSGTIDFVRCTGAKRDPRLFRCTWQTSHRIAEVRGRADVRFRRKRVQVIFTARTCTPISISALCDLFDVPLHTPFSPLS